MSAMQAAGRVLTLDELIDVSVVSHDLASVIVEITTDDGPEQVPVSAVEAWDNDVLLHIEWTPNEREAACVQFVKELAESKAKHAAAQRARELVKEHDL